MLALLALGILQSPGIEFVTRAERLETLVPKLGIQLHRDLRVGRELADEVVLISVHSATEAGLLDDLARVAGAEWVATGDALKLQRTPQLQRSLDRQERQYREEIFREAQSGLRDRSAKIGAFTSESARKLGDQIDRYYRRDNLNNYEDKTNDQMLSDFDAWDAVMDATPSTFAARNLIASLEPSTFMDLEDGDRRILERWPNRAQSPIGTNADLAVRQFIDGQKLWAAEVVRRGERNPPDIRQGWDPYDHAEVPYPNDLGIRIQAMPYATRDFGYQFLTTFRNRTGKALHYATEVLFGTPKAERFAPTDLLESEVRYVTPPDILEFRSNPDKSRLKAVLASEPLSFSTGPTLRQGAELAHRDIVAYLPDNSLNLRRLPGGTPATVGKVWRTVVEQLQVAIEDNGKRLLVRPLMPVQESNRRSPRAALQKLLTQMPPNGPSIDGLAEYTLARTANGIDWVLRNLLLQLAPAAVSTVETPDPVILRLYGSLSDPQLRTFARGGSIPMGNLSIRQQEFVRTALLRRQGLGFSVNRPKQTNSVWRNGVALDVTDYFPNGVANDLQVSMKTDSETMLVRKAVVEGTVHLLPISLEEEVERAMTFSRNRNNIDVYLSGLPTFGVGTRRQLTFEFRLDEETSFERTLTDSVPSVTFGRFADLPKSTQKMIREAMLQEVQRRKEIDDATPTRKSPPPR